jgi:hypothetical protein
MRTSLRIAVSGTLLAAAALAQSEMNGILIDAGCRDRSAVNLRQPPERIVGKVPLQPPVSASGITVDAKTAHAERADILLHQVPDLATRQYDPTCAITAGTRAYAVLLDNGKLFDLDEGGNTLATEAIYATDQGRALWNGAAYGVKPRVKIRGRIVAGRVLTDAVICQ